MNLFTKVTPWVVASLALLTTTFGQNNKVSEPKKANTTQNPMMPGYNASSAIAVNQGWDFFSSAAFTYWQASNDNTVTEITTPGQPNIAVLPNKEYKPGFEITLGLNLNRDGWDTLTRYTWFRGTTLTINSLPPEGNQSFFSHGTYCSNKWRLHMDLLDWEIGRSYFVGSKLSFRPFMAARAAWIRQYQHTVYTAENFVRNMTYSWGIGPRFGLKMDWMLGQGIRLFGDCGMDTLFTQYTTIFNRENNTSNEDGSFTHNQNVLRTHLDVELGLGWGMYFAKDAYHVDLTAGYGFQTFFKNYLAGNTNIQDLYLQGLTITARFDF